MWNQGGVWGRLICAGPCGQCKSMDPQLASWCRCKGFAGTTPQLHPMTAMLAAPVADEASSVTRQHLPEKR